MAFSVAPTDAVTMQSARGDLLGGRPWICDRLLTRRCATTLRARPVQSAAVHCSALPVSAESDYKLKEVRLVGLCPFSCLFCALSAGFVQMVDARAARMGNALPALVSCFSLVRTLFPPPPPQLFAEDVRYFLPAYQRNYCWKQDTAIGFLQHVLDRVRDGYDELHSALEVTRAGHEKRLPTDEIRRWTLEQIPESIGFIVLYRGREDGLFGVIDGQQRMVTLGFIFAALRECFLQSGNAVDAACAEEMHDRIWQRPHLSRGLAATARLTVRNIDVDLYHQLCLVPGGMQALLDREADRDDVSSSESHSKMLDAQRIILETLMEQPPCIWRMLASYLPECKYNMLLSQDAITALKMFGSLNFKGAEQMGAVDRFRSAIVMEDEADLNTNVAATARAVPSVTGGTPTRVGSLLEPVWDELQADYGRQFIAAAVLRAIQCRLGLLEGKHNYWQDSSSLTLADKYDTEARLMLSEANVPPSAFFYGPFSRLLKQYRVVERASLPGGAHGNAIERLLQSLKGCTLVAWEPVAYAYMRSRLDDDGVPLPGVVPEIEVFLLTLDRFVFYVLLVEGGVLRLARLNAVLEAVSSGKDPLKLMVLGTKSLEKLEAALSCPRLGGRDPALVKAVLLRVNAAVHSACDAASDGAAAVAPAFDSTEWSVEHVLPTKPAARGAWARVFPDEFERKSLVNLLGNLALLTPSANSSAGNMGFSKKKEKYQRLLGAGMPRITADIVAADGWDKQSILRRQARYVQLLMQPYWDCSRPAA